ncbi:hypothetical protein GLIP_1253 [Aliiglaciecola lipolytica E3]|uniref:Uncharacterized protein n=1 Tax=Aliiglaciecola lipolytica E3 TaxID=1127673 RepID=K6WZQ6_9ALTE|nr:hypothetical protein GLIP_1253 [Aliiglaciecola lipolytica E3]
MKCIDQTPPPKAILLTINATCRRFGETVVAAWEQTWNAIKEANIAISNDSKTNL